MAPDLKRAKLSKLISLASLGVVVRPRSEWPVAYASFKGPVLLPKATRLHTTQSHVKRAVVEEKKQALQDGAALFVQVIRERDLWWVFNGHHTLVALMDLKADPVYAFFEHTREPRAHSKLLEPPKLV